MSGIIKLIRNFLMDSFARLAVRFSRIESVFISITKRWPHSRIVDIFYRRGIETFLIHARRSGTNLKRVSLGQISLVLDVSEFTTTSLYFRSILYEPNTTRFILALGAELKSFVDVGANHGYFSLIAAELMGSGGRVYGFEPNPEVRRQWVELIGRNNLADRIVVSALALSDVDAADVDLFVSKTPTNSGLSSLTPFPQLLENGALAPDHVIKVQTRTFDTWSEHAGNPAIDLVKIDVEGAEEKVLRGMIKTLSKAPPFHIICETIWSGPAHELLLSFGYVASKLDTYGDGSGNILYRHSRLV